MPNVIDRFTGDYKFLSNFADAPIELGDGVYPTSEHLYQALKFESRDVQQTIRQAPTPGKAKRLGNSTGMTESEKAVWERIKVDAMRLVLSLKFKAHPDLAAKLLDTGDATLIEGNNHGDKYWGTVDGEGENWLGRLLMELRDMLRHESASGGS